MIKKIVESNVQSKATTTLAKKIKSDASHILISLLFGFDLLLFSLAFQVESQPTTSCMRDQRLWSVQECADIFAESLNSLSKDLVNQGEGGILVWDKVN